MGMFEKKEAAAKPAPKKKGKEKLQINLEALRQYTILDAVIKQATALQSTLKGEINEASFSTFTGLVGKAAERPSSFEGVSTGVTASLEVRKRSSASVLTDAEVELLKENDIVAEEKVITPFHFYINPAHVNNKDLLAKVEKALAKIVPEDFIQQQDEVKKFVVNDTMLDEAFKNGAPEEVLRVLTTLAVKAKFTEDYDQNNVVRDAFEIMQPGSILGDVIKPIEKPATAKVKKVASK